MPPTPTRTPSTSAAASTISTWNIAPHKREYPPPRMLAAMDVAHSSLLLSSRLKLRRDGSPYARSILDPDLQVLDRRALQLHTGSTPLPIKSAEECVQ